MRVALFTDTFAPQINGVTMTLNRLVQYWQRQGIQSLVYAPDDDGQGEDSPEIRRVPSLPFPLYPECRIPMSGYAGIERELLSFKPDLLHLVTPFTLGLIGHRFGRHHQVPMVASYHTNFDQYLDYYRLNYFHRLCARPRVSRNLCFLRPFCFILYSLDYWVLVILTQR